MSVTTPNSAALDTRERQPADFHGSRIALIFAAAIFSCLSAVFLYFVGESAIYGFHWFEFFVDSDTYYDFYFGFSTGVDDLIAVSHNYVGPMTILYVFGGNVYLIMLFNVFIFTFSVIKICEILNTDPLRTAAILMCSAMTVSSLLSVNKEILTFPFLACALMAYQRRSFPLVIGAILISILIRWQMTGFYIAIVMLYTFRIQGLNRYFVIGAFLIMISMTYYALQDVFEPVFESADASIRSYTGGSGLFEAFVEYQRNGYYFLVFSLKAAHLMFSLGTRVGNILHPIEIYNDLFVGLYCVANMAVFLALAATKKLTLRYDLIAVSLIFLIVFALTPMFAPRYLYPAFVLWALVLSGAPARIARVGEGPPQRPALRSSASRRAGLDRR